MLEEVGRGKKYEGGREEELNKSWKMGGRKKEEKMEGAGDQRFIHKQFTILSPFALTPLTRCRLHLISKTRNI